MYIRGGKLLMRRPTTDEKNKFQRFYFTSVSFLFRIITFLVHYYLYSTQVRSLFKFYLIIIQGIHRLCRDNVLKLHSTEILSLLLFLIYIFLSSICRMGISICRCLQKLSQVIRGKLNLMTCDTLNLMTCDNMGMLQQLHEVTATFTE